MLFVQNSVWRYAKLLYSVITKTTIMSSINKSQITGIILSALAFVALLNSGYFFTSILKLSILKWLVFNACSFAIIIHVVCFTLHLITKRDLFLAISLLPLYYYGTMGLFVMPWNEANIFAQITHIIITANVAWILFKLLKERKFEDIGKGLLISTLLLVPAFAFIQSFAQEHMDEFLTLLKNL